jgi:hypothetical protein
VRRAGLVAAGVAVLCGCSSPQIETAGEWDLVEASLPDGHWSTTGGGSYHLSIGTDELTGTFGCSSGMTASDFVQDGDHLSLGEVTAGYGRGCYPHVPDPLAGRFETALEAVDSVERSGDVLILRGDEVVLTFERGS